MTTEFRPSREFLINTPITITRVYEYNMHPGDAVDRGIRHKNLGLNIYVHTYAYDHPMPTTERKTEAMAPNPFVYTGVPANMLMMLVEKRYNNMIDKHVNSILWK